MGQFLNNPAVILAIIALIGAVTNWINSLVRNNDLNQLHKLTAKHEEQLNGGFVPRVQAVINPVVTNAVNRVAQSTSDPPKVQ